MAGPLKIGPIAAALALCAGAAWAGEAPAAYYPSLGYGQVPPWVYAEAPGHGQVPPDHDRALVYGDAGPPGPPPGYVGEPAYGPDFGPGPDFAPDARPDPGSYGPPHEEGYDSGWVDQERAAPGYRSYSGSRVQTYDYDSGWQGSGAGEQDIAPQPLPPVGQGYGYSDGRSWRPCCAPPPPCPCRRMRPTAYQPGLRLPDLGLNDRFFADSGGVGPAYLGGGGGGGGVYVVSGGGARATAFASASARASVSIRGRAGGHAGHCCGK